MSAKRPANLKEFAARSLSDSVRWFPESSKWTHTKRVVHFAMGISGEAGEVLEHVKKMHRGGSDLDAEAVAVEVVDVLMYCFDLAAELGETYGVEIDRLFEQKRALNEERFGGAL